MWMRMMMTMTNKYVCFDRSLIQFFILHYLFHVWSHFTGTTRNSISLSVPDMDAGA